MRRNNKSSDRGRQRRSQRRSFRDTSQRRYRAPQTLEDFKSPGYDVTRLDDPSYAPALTKRNTWGTLAGQAIDGDRHEGSVCLMFNNYGLNTAWWDNSDDPPMGDEVYKGLHQLARSAGADRLDTTVLQSLADVIPQMVLLISSFVLSETAAKHAQGLESSATDAASMYPLTAATRVALRKELLLLGWVPEIVFTLVDLYCTAIQWQGSIPGRQYLPGYLMPVGYRSTSATQMRTLLQQILARKSSEYMAIELKVPGRYITEDDLLPRRPVPADSDYGLLVCNMMPTYTENGSSTRATQTFTFGRSGDTRIFYNERMGIPDLADASIFWCADTNPRSAPTYQCLLAPADAGTDVTSLWTATETSTTVTQLATSATYHNWIWNYASGVGATGAGDKMPYHAYRNFDTTTFTETYWNLKALNSIVAFLRGEKGSYSHVEDPSKLLAEVRSVYQLRRARDGKGNQPAMQNTPGTRGNPSQGKSGQSNYTGGGESSSGSGRGGFAI